MIVNKRIEDYIGTLNKELPDNLKKIEKEALSEHVPIIKKPAQSLLRFVISSKQPKSILEVGTAVGFSSLLMSEYMPSDCHITTIEKMESRIVKAKENIKMCNREEKITILQGDATKILCELEDSYDIIFLDAAKGQYINFLDEILRRLNDGGYLISDNVLQNGDVCESRYGVTRRNRTIHSRMREYLYTITHIDCLETMVLPIGDGVTVSIMNKEKYKQ